MHTKLQHAASGLYISTRRIRTSVRVCSHMSESGGAEHSSILVLISPSFVERLSFYLLPRTLVGLDGRPVRWAFVVARIVFAFVPVICELCTFLSDGNN